MEETIVEILPFIFAYGIIAGFGIATIFNILARGIFTAFALIRHL